MPYMIRSKVRPLRIRDGSTLADPMRLLIPGEPVLFLNLPRGLAVGEFSELVIALVSEDRAPEIAVIKTEDHQFRKARKGKRVR